ncbi:hypothetical protein PRIPAC_96055, partial [Pristionchus pacificus]
PFFSAFVHQSDLRRNNHDHIVDSFHLHSFLYYAVPQTGKGLAWESWQRSAIC